MEWLPIEIQTILDWAFERHLNPLSWYLRPIFLIIICYFAYKRSLKGIIITFLLMSSSMVWFPSPETIDPEMKVVLEYEKMLLSNPMTAIVTLFMGVIFVALACIAFWKRSLTMGLVIVNSMMIGKVVLGLIFTGENGWAPIGTTIFGLLIVNTIGFTLLNGCEKKNCLYKQVKTKPEINNFFKNKKGANCLGENVSIPLRQICRIEIADWNSTRTSFQYWIDL